MPALPAGTAAPDFRLKSMHGKEFSLREALTHGPVLLAFFKVSCPTCQYSFPFYERLFRKYQNRHVTLVGISQNSAQDTAAFAREFGISLPLLFDDIPYPVSSAYGLTNVPTLFWVSPEGKIELTSVGWSKPDFETINRKMAEEGAIALVSLFQPGEDVRDYRAG
ncbi:MAG TPA: TlpA disulfide reductase family protein [Terriglobales bacterium]|nr:TlpA disulfide reductase family protein [Terriglobales bacterium]